MKYLCISVVIAGLCAGCLSAETVDLLNTQIYNTGVDNSGAVTSGSELHYVLQNAPADTPGLIVQSTGTGAPIPPWVGNSATSAWIGPNAPNSNGLAGQYDYRITFDLTGLDASTAVLMGSWSTDNSGDDILINGVSTGNSIAYGTDPNYSFTALHPFSIAGGFVSGINTLDFVLTNEDNGQPENPTGLRVDFSEADAAAAPEPGTVGLLGFASLAVSATFKRRVRRV